MEYKILTAPNREFHPETFWLLLENGVCIFLPRIKGELKAEGRTHTTGCSRGPNVNINLGPEITGCRFHPEAAAFDGSSCPYNNNIERCVKEYSKEIKEATDLVLL